MMLISSVVLTTCCLLFSSLSIDACQDINIEMYDSFGDGWSGNILHIGDEEITLSKANASGNTAVCLEDGTYTPYCCGGTWGFEVSWNVVNANGYTYLSGGADSVCNATWGSFTVCDGCPTASPTVSPPCQDFNVEMYDSWGDGWSGNILHIGNEEITLPSNASGIEAVCLADGTYTPYCCGGTYPSEISWNVVDADGITSLSGGASTGCDAEGSFTVISPTASPTSSPTGSPTASPTSSPTSSPTASPTSSPTPECHDTTWTDQRNGKGCDWVARKPDKRCTKRSSSTNMVAYEGCPLTCDNCEFDGCYDDKTWADARNGKDCFWIARNPDKRCTKRSSSVADGGVSANDACLFTCGNCNTNL